MIVSINSIYGDSIRYGVFWYQVRDWCGLPASRYGHSSSSSSTLCGQVNRYEYIIILLKPVDGGVLWTK
jgi:hypothetical protein